jgi:hypothetical protein
MYSKAFATAGEAAGVDAAGVGQRAGWGAVILDDGEERGDHVLASDRLMGGAGEQVAGVIIKPVEDLDVGLVGQPPVDEVRLPHLVGLRHLEAQIGRSGPLSRLRGDQPRLLQDPMDRRWRRRPAAFLLEVPGDRVRSGVQTVRGQLHPQLDYPVTNGLGRAGRRGLRAAGARL